MVNLMHATFAYKQKIASNISHFLGEILVLFIEDRKNSNNMLDFKKQAWIAW